jgi:hypothetical protein
MVELNEMKRTSQVHTTVLGEQIYLSGSFRQRVTEEACCENIAKFSTPSTCDTPRGKALPEEYFKGDSLSDDACPISCSHKMDKHYGQNNTWQTTHTKLRRKIQFQSRKNMAG